MLIQLQIQIKKKRTAPGGKRPDHIVEFIFSLPNLPFTSLSRMEKVSSWADIRKQKPSDIFPN